MKLASVTCIISSSSSSNSKTTTPPPPPHHYQRQQQQPDRTTTTTTSDGKTSTAPNTASPGANSNTKDNTNKTKYEKKPPAPEHAFQNSLRQLRRRSYARTQPHIRQQQLLFHAPTRHPRTRHHHRSRPSFCLRCSCNASCACRWYLDAARSGMKTRKTAVGNPCWRGGVYVWGSTGSGLSFLLYCKTLPFACCIHQRVYDIHKKHAVTQKHAGLTNYMSGMGRETLRVLRGISG